MEKRRNITKQPRTNLLEWTSPQEQQQQQQQQYEVICLEENTDLTWPTFVPIQQNEAHHHHQQQQQFTNFPTLSETQEQIISLPEVVDQEQVISLPEVEEGMLLKLLGHHPEDQCGKRTSAETTPTAA